MITRNRRIRLLPKEALIKTGPVDHADWNYRPFLGLIIQLRFKLIVSLLPKHKVPRLLEVGYGCGMFMPELICHCDELYGIDIHPKQQEVTAQLQKFGVNAHLCSESAEAMRFQDQFFDCVVALSSLEFVEDIAAASREIRRVLKPDGCLVMVTPGHSPLVDFCLKLLTGKSAKKDYGDHRQSLIPTLLQRFTIQRKRTAPRFGSAIICLYKALRLCPQPEKQAIKHPQLVPFSEAQH